MKSQPSPAMPESPARAPTSDDVARVELLGDAYRRLTGEISKIIVGQKDVIDLLLISLFAGGATRNRWSLPEVGG